MPSRLVAYAATLAASACLVAALLAIAGWTLGEPWVVVCLAVVSALAERTGVWLTSRLQVSASMVPTLFAAILFGPLAAMAVAAAAMLVDVRAPTDRPHLRWLTYTSIRALTAAAVGGLAIGIRDVSPGIGGIAAAAIAGAVVAEALDGAFYACTLALRQVGEIRAHLRTLVALVLVSIPLYAPIVALLVIAYEQISPITLPLFLVPSLAAQRLFALYQGQRHLTGELKGANDRLERANLSFATALVATVEARDRYTAGHSAAVAIYARDIACRMALASDQQQLAHLCGLVHDVGKIGLPVGLLEKPGALTLEERRQMERHSEIGERILRNVEDYAEIAAIVRHHHERWDGQGYPDGLSREEIPLLSRIIAVADAYNAMTSDRPYRDAMPSRVARLRLAQAAESQFDTSVVAAFEAVLAGATESYRTGRREDFMLESDASEADERNAAVA
jgi:HD-GYP domain-containing protein (c-di-GMP phosphodiesterase class II)